MKITLITVAACITTMHTFAAPEAQRSGTLHPPDNNQKPSTETVSRLLQMPLTASSAVQIALLNNRELKAAYAELGISRANLIEAVTLPNPSIDFDAQFAVTGASMNRYGWLIAEDFVQLLMRPLRRRFAQAEFDAARLRMADQILELESQVKAALFSYKADQAIIAQLGTAMDTSGASVQLSQQLFQAGNTTELALLEQQDSYDQSCLELTRAQTDMRTQREMLNRLLGVSGSEADWRTVAELPKEVGQIPSISRLEFLAISRRDDLQAAAKDLNSRALALGLTKKYRWLATFKIGFTGERDIDGALNMGPSLDLELPIFNSGRDRIVRGEAQLAIAQARLESLALDIHSKVRELHDKLAGLHEITGFYRTEIIPTRARLVKQSLLQYNAMQINQYSLLNAKARELEADRQYTEALRDYWITRAQLERTVGGSLDVTRLNRPAIQTNSPSIP